MRFIPVAARNILDYLYAFLTAASPWLFGFAWGGSETYIPATAGIIVLVISLITNYKYSLAKVIAFNTHLVLDIFIGLFLILSPWLFGFSGYIYIPHVTLGAAAIILSLVSKRFVNYLDY